MSRGVGSNAWRQPSQRHTGSFLMVSADIMLHENIDLEDCSIDWCGPKYCPSTFFFFYMESPTNVLDVMQQSTLESRKALQ